MDMQRRDVLKYSAIFGLMASAGLITPAQAQEWNKAAFEGKTLDDVFKVPPAIIAGFAVQANRFRLHYTSTWRPSAKRRREGTCFLDV